MDFSEKLFHSLVDYATVHSDGRVVFTFRNGAEVSKDIKSREQPEYRVCTGCLRLFFLCVFRGEVKTADGKLCTARLL